MKRKRDIRWSDLTDEQRDIIIDEQRDIVIDALLGKMNYLQGQDFPEKEDKVKSC